MGPSGRLRSIHGAHASVACSVSTQHAVRLLAASRLCACLLCEHALRVLSCHSRPLTTRGRPALPPCPHARRLSRACTCPEVLDDDMVAAALEASNASSSRHRSIDICIGTQPNANPPTPSFGSHCGSMSRSGGSGNAGASLVRSGSGASTQEQLFAAQADASQAHAQVQCLHKALNQVSRAAGSSCWRHLLHTCAPAEHHCQALGHGAPASCRLQHAAGCQV